MLVVDLLFGGFGIFWFGLFFVFLWVYVAWWLPGLVCGLRCELWVLVIVWPNCDAGGGFVVWVVCLVLAVVLTLYVVEFVVGLVGCVAFAYFLVWRYLDCLLVIWVWVVGAVLILYCLYVVV